MGLDWALTAILGAALFFVFEPAYLKTSHLKPQKKALSLTFKALATGMALLLAIIGFVRAPGAFGLFMVIGMSVCLAADVLIGVKFALGVFAFLLGHLFYMPAFLQTYELKWQVSLPVFVFGLLLVWLLFHNHFAKAGKNLAPLLLYSVILNAMLALGAPAFLPFDGRGVLLAFGAVFFVVSDLLLAHNAFVKKSRATDVISLTFYYAAQFLFGLSVFAPTMNIYL